MKKITNKTILKQGYKTYRSIEADGVIYWIDFYKHIEGIHSVVSKNVWSVRYDKPIVFGEHENSYLNECFQIAAQSQPKLEGIPVISLDSYVERLAIKSKKLAIWEYAKEYKFHFTNGYKSNPNQYTQKDIDKAIDIAKGLDIKSGVWYTSEKFNKEQIFEQINSISVIEVDENFNIINYE